MFDHKMDNFANKIILEMISFLNFETLLLEEEINLKSSNMDKL